jgi:benzoate-CoA ligase
VDILGEWFNAGTLVDRDLEAGRGGNVALRRAGEQLTDMQLHDRVMRAGNLLREPGVRREDRVLLILDDSPAFPAPFLGAMRIGAVPAPVSFLDTTEHFQHYARDAYARVIVAEDALLERLGGVPGTLLARSACERRLALHPGEHDPVDTHRDDMAFWLFSGGSTGFPKGAVHLPHCIAFADELPKTPTGRIQRCKLRELG